MSKTIIYESLRDRFPDLEKPEWHDKAVRWLRGNSDQGLFGLYLYELIRSDKTINRILNIGTARGYSTVCAARGLADSNRDGQVSTIDVIPPRRSRKWGAKNNGEDPLVDGSYSIHELVSKFHDPESDDVPINFYQGDSNSVLTKNELGAFDLVFHDAKHTYEQVADDISTIINSQKTVPMMIFDDCYIHEYKNVLGFDLPELCRSIPLLSHFERRIRKYSVIKIPYLGVKEAVEEYFHSEYFESMEIVEDKDHCPVTALFPH